MSHKFSILKEFARNLHALLHKHSPLGVKEYNIMQPDLICECIRLRECVVQPVNDKYLGPLDLSTVKNTKHPLVLLLGNHSSGKSSFINHLLQREVQSSGVAPTDDSFTIIAPGPADVDRAGPTLVGDPDLGFSGLTHFGPVLVHKTQLKVRKLTDSPAADGPARLCDDFTIVDTPGMIDSPVKANASRAERIMDRGYDFEGVVRWYAERADLVLLFFDPDKPGTTGETLSCLVNSLQGFDHKLHLCLNKADQFLRISDFARAYGSLCWNLSKVIPRKDLPQIHTMCLPPRLLQRMRAARDGERESEKDKPQPQQQQQSIQGGEGGAGEHKQEQRKADVVQEEHFLARGLASLDAERRAVEAEVFNTPRRRVDNEISRLADSVHVLLMHCRVVDEAVAAYQSALWRARYTTMAASLGGAVLSALAFVGTQAYTSWRLTNPIASASASSSSSSSSVGPIPVPAVVTAMLGAGEIAVRATQAGVNAFVASLGASALGVTALHLWQRHALDSTAGVLSRIGTFTAIFRRLYARQIDQNDEFTLSLWATVRARLCADIAYQAPVTGSDERALSIGSEVAASTSATAAAAAAAAQTQAQVSAAVRPGIHMTNRIVGLDRVSSADFLALRRILDREIPDLRRRAARNSAPEVGGKYNYNAYQYDSYDHHGQVGSGADAAALGANGMRQGSLLQPLPPQAVPAISLSSAGVVYHGTRTSYDTAQTFAKTSQVVAHAADAASPADASVLTTGVEASALPSVAALGSLARTAPVLLGTPLPKAKSAAAAAEPEEARISGAGRELD